MRPGIRAYSLLVRSGPVRSGPVRSGPVWSGLVRSGPAGPVWFSVLLGKRRTKGARCRVKGRTSRCVERRRPLFRTRATQT